MNRIWIEGDEIEYTQQDRFRKGIAAYQDGDQYDVNNVRKAHGDKSA